MSTAADALATGAPCVWDEAAGNVCVESQAGDGNATAQTFAHAAHVVGLRTIINRVTGVPMEPRAVLAVWAAGRVTLYAGSGGSQRIRGDLAGALGLPEDAVRVVAQDVGGNLGGSGRPPCPPTRPPAA